MQKKFQWRRLSRGDWRDEWDDDCLEKEASYDGSIFLIFVKQKETYEKALQSLPSPF
jgi:hypothetical protein